MSGPRNRPAFERGQAIRAAIRDHLLEHARLHPLSRPPTWRRVQAHLRTRRYYLERSTICAYLASIRLEADLAELGRSSSDSLSPNEAA